MSSSESERSAMAETFDASFFERLIRNPSVSLLFPYVLGSSGASPIDDELESQPESRDHLYMFDPRNRLMVIFENPEDFEDIMRAMPDGKDGPSPASKASIEAMPTVMMGEGGGECSICLEDVVIGGEAKEMPCRHVFHGICIEKWLGMHGSCPLCRYQMPADEEDESTKVEGEEGEEEEEEDEEERGAVSEVREDREGGDRREISVRVIFNYNYRRRRSLSSDPNSESQPGQSDPIPAVEVDLDAVHESSTPQDMES